MLFIASVVFVVVVCALIGAVLGSMVRHGKGKRTATKQGKFIAYDPRAPWKGGYYE